MKPISLVALLLLQTSLLAGCLLIDGGENGTLTRFDVQEGAFDALVVMGDRPSVALDIPYRLKNMGSTDVALSGCNVPASALLQKRQDDEWITVFGEGRYGCFELWRYGSGEVFDDTLNVFVELDPSSPLEPRWYRGGGIEGLPVEGTYRLEQRVYDADGLERGSMTLLTLRQRISREFEVHPIYDIPLASAPVEWDE